MAAGSFVAPNRFLASSADRAGTVSQDMAANAAASDDGGARRPHEM